jgi:osomolarity two-component system response regulator SKN7
MNDVLPKPFTKEGLLHMLEKHLAHLKKPIHQIEGMVPPQLLATTRQSLKDEESPAKSPATASNWNSPGQIPGVSPVGSSVNEEFMNTVQGHPAAYSVNPMGANLAYNSSPQMSIPQRQQGLHRRQISDIAGGDEINNPAKRQQMYAAPLQPQPMNPMQRPR